MNAAFILQELLSVADPEKAISLRGVRIKKRLYAEGDVILGITVPLVRNIVKKIAKKNPAIPLNEIQILLDSEYHEVRLAGFLFLVKQFKFRKTTETERKEIYNFYLKNIRRANNWDLVDVSCRDIIGRYLLDKTDRSILYRWPKAITFGNSGCPSCQHGYLSKTGSLTIRLLLRKNYRPTGTFWYTKPSAGCCGKSGEETCKRLPVFWKPTVKKCRTRLCSMLSDISRPTNGRIL
jgi:hypothetical protein